MAEETLTEEAEATTAGSETLGISEAAAAGLVAKSEGNPQKQRLKQTAISERIVISFG